MNPVLSLNPKKQKNDLNDHINYSIRIIFLTKVAMNFNRTTKKMERKVSKRSNQRKKRKKKKNRTVQFLC